MPDEAIQFGKCALTASYLRRAKWKRRLKGADQQRVGGETRWSAFAFGFGAQRCDSALAVTAFLFTFLRIFRRKTPRFGRRERLRGRRTQGPNVGGITSSSGLILSFFSLARCPSRVPQARSTRASVFWSVHGQPQSS